MPIDASQLRAFALRLEGSARTTQRETRAVITKGAVKIKNRLRAEASGSTHFGQIARTINFDITEAGAFGGGVTRAEIGPDKRHRSARLGNIAYFGTSRGGGTLPDPQGALDAEAPEVERWILDAAVESL